MTQSDGIDCAAAISLAWDELEPGKMHGYCFFTLNDRFRAVDGEGLSLSFGTFQAQPPEPPAPAPARCPSCNGRGFIPAAEPGGWPKSARAR
jgi:hypothetical protein